jgi:hypothetical protein
MLSLLKKKSDAAAAPLVPSWHPNFRNYEKLPDVKVVRTAFFINAVAVTVTVTLAVFLGFQEWKTQVLHGQIADAERRIQQDRKTSDLAVANFKKFQAEEAKIKEVDVFLKVRPAVSDLIVHLGRTLPPHIALDTLDLREASVILRLSVSGASHDVAAGYATEYLQQLQGDTVLAQWFEPARMTNLSRNPATGRLVVEILAGVKGAGGKK